MNLEKNKIYQWNMGAEPLHIIHIGLVSEHPGLIPSSSVGIAACYLFQWRYKSADGLGNYIVLSLPAFSKWCSEAEDIVDTSFDGKLFSFGIFYANGNFFASEFKYKSRTIAIKKGYNYIKNKN